MWAPQWRSKTTSLGCAGASLNSTATLLAAPASEDRAGGPWPVARSARYHRSLPAGRDGGGPMLGTGFPRADVENDFLRARRRQFLAMLADRLRGGRGDGNRLIPLDEVVGPLGWRGQRQLGLQTIRLDTIVGTPGARRDFDRRFRPTSTRPRSRWEQLALAQRRGAARRSRRSRSTASATCTSWPTATTVSPSPRRPGRT